MCALVSGLVFEIQGFVVKEAFGCGLRGFTNLLAEKLKFHHEHSAGSLGASPSIATLGPTPGRPP